ncbi:capsid triplex subunit 1 [Equid gammaherpesvirus 2]|nr:capsid triplex subunit 1 [Equid gammaherpesvirus 2]
MKTKEVTPRGDSGEKLARDLLRLVPPQTHKLGTFRASELGRDLRAIVANYAPKTISGHIQIFRDDFIAPPYRQPLYGEFLVHAKTFHPQEPRGTFVFAFSVGDGPECTSVDTIFSPVSLFRVCGLGADAAPHTHRISHIWYESESDFLNVAANVRELIENCSLHKFLSPVGPLVQNIQSTFLNKITTVVKGEVLSNRSPPENIKLVLPSDLFFDMDETCPYPPSGDPVKPRVCYYICILYVMVNNIPSASLQFFRTGKGDSDVVFFLRRYYSDAIANKITVLGDNLDINNLTLGAVCMLGYSSSQSTPGRGNLHFRSYSLPTVEVSDFVAQPGSWTLI